MADGTVTNDDHRKGNAVMNDKERLGGWQERRTARQSGRNEDGVVE